MQSIDSIETHVYGTIKDLISRKEEIKCGNIIKEYNRTIDDVTKENTKEHNPNWPEICDNPFRILDWRLWIKKNKLIIQFEKSATKY